MRIKKFTAKTFAEALELVKKELSHDAVILSTEEKKGLRPHVEVTAGIDDETADGAAPNASLGYALSEDKNQKPKAEISASLQTARVDDLKSDINSLRSLIEGMKNSGYGVSLPEKKRVIMNFLLDRAVREEYALRVCDRTTDVSEIPLMLSADIKVKRHSGTKKVVMLIGPTGVGKTTTVAKLAAQAVKSGRKTALINLDTYRIGATEQVRIYSRILGIPLADASNVAEFRAGLLKFSESRDVIFVDTAGRNPRDEAYLNELSEICKADIPVELHLLMSANGDDECMIEAYRSYRKLPIDYIAFTKVDEAVKYGALYNLLLTYQKPVAYLTTGQRVPGDIEYPTVSRLAGLIVKKECYPC